jgi:hypothetical protein
MILGKNLRLNDGLLKHLGLSMTPIAVPHTLSVLELGQDSVRTASDEHPHDKKRNYGVHSHLDAARVTR